MNTIIYRSYTYIQAYLARVHTKRVTAQRCAYLLALIAGALDAHPPSATVSAVKLCALFCFFFMFYTFSANCGQDEVTTGVALYAYTHAKCARCCHLNIICAYICLYVHSNCSSTKRICVYMLDMW